MKYLNKKQTYIGVCILQTLLLLFNSGCKKRDDLISLNNGAIDPTEFYYTDTLTILSSTVREDSIPSRMASNQQLAGKMNDPMFGTSESAIFTQVRLKTVNKLIEAENGADSAFIYLTFTSEVATYGNLNSEQSFTVYELSEGLDPKKTYYSNDSLKYTPTEVGNFKGVFNLKDEVWVKDTAMKKTLPGIKIKLNKDFANKLINAKATNINTQAAFSDYIKGLYIKPTGNPNPGEGAIVGFNFKEASTQIHVYYDGNKHVDFSLDSAAVKFSQYKVSEQPSNILSQKNNPLSDYDMTYVQALTGAKTFFRFPNLFSIATESKIFIHKAEFIIPVSQNVLDNKYPEPTRLLLNQPDEKTGLNLPLIDLISSEATYGGLYNKSLGEYRFIITRHIQDLFNSYLNDGDDFNNGLYLTNTIDLPITPARVIIDTKKDPTAEKKLKLVIVYSKL